MAATKKSLANTDETAVTQTNGTEGLPNLLSRLGDDVMQLINSQFALFKVEVKEEASAYARNAALLNVAIAFAVSTLFARANFSQPASYALGFVATGVFYLLVGGILALVMKNRLAKQQLVPPMTVQELRKDKQWLKSEL
jgi:uncharacterized membrane protein YqjE